MSGAEAAGLAVGVIALASVFYLVDYDLACTKINILHQRLSDWGNKTHIREPGSEHPFLLEPSQRGVVANSLRTLRDILSDTEGLRQK